MPFDPPKYTILATIAAVALALVVNIGYGLLLLHLRGTPSQEMTPLFRDGAPYLILGLFLMAVSAILSVRLADHRPDACWIGLAAGAGLGLMVIVAATVQGRFDLWLLPNAGLAAVGGWLGESVCGTRRN